MARVKVLNWYNRPKLTKGLRKFLSRRRGEGCCSVVTMRYGSKWANRLNPDDRVGISISDDSEKPRIIGYAAVGHVKKTLICFLEADDLRKNIGTAKTWIEVLEDMISIYGEHVGYNISATDVVSVIELVGPIVK